MTTTTDYRAALSELADRLENWNSAKPHHDDMEAVRSARALLAAPEAVGVADEAVEAWADLAGYIKGNGDHPCGFWVEPDDLGKIVRNFAHPAPVPVGERLPCAEDCDAEGRCWFHSAGRRWKDWYFLKASAVTDTETHWLPHWALPLPEAHP
jgi:hypothetical protein